MLTKTKTEWYSGQLKHPLFTYSDCRKDRNKKDGAVKRRRYKLFDARRTGRVKAFSRDVYKMLWGKIPESYTEGEE